MLNTHLRNFMINLFVQGVNIGLKEINSQKYISLTDIAKKKNSDDPRFVIKNWLRNRSTVDFLGIWESIHNSHFNRVEFDSVREKTGYNWFALSPSDWIKKTNAIGINSKPGRYGGTYAHEDIALEFATWISPEFKLYFIKEFRRLKQEENNRLHLDWNLKRSLTKINYKIQTDVIEQFLIPPELTEEESNLIYASEADLLNKALFGTTAHEWRKQSPEKENLREQANITQLVVLANLESLNAEFIKQNLPQKERLLRLNTIARYQMMSLLNNNQIKKLE